MKKKRQAEQMTGENAGATGSDVMTHAMEKMRINAAARIARVSQQLETGARRLRTGILAISLGLCFAMGVALAPQAALANAAGTVDAVRIDTFPKLTRIVLEADIPMTPRIFTLAEPDRLVIDLPEVDWGIPNAAGSVDSPLIRSYRYGLHLPGVSRLVLDLAAPARFRGFKATPAESGHRLLIDLEPLVNLAALPKQPVPPRQAAPRRSPEEREPRAVVPTPQVTEDPARRELDAALQAAERMGRAMAMLRPQAAPAPGRTLAPVAPVQPPSQPAQPAAPEATAPEPEAAPDVLVAAPAEPVFYMPTPRPRPDRNAPETLLPPMQVAAAEAAPAPALAPETDGFDPLRIDFKELRALFSRVSNGIPAPDARSAAAAEEAIDPRRRKAAETPRDETRMMSVVIDPGHGGKDPGALRRGIKEKDLVLEFSRTLKQVLEESGRYRVRMTREADFFVTLEDRVEFARVIDADLLLSIHADALEQDDVHGVTAYMLSDKASAKQVSTLADESEEVAGVDLAEESRDVARILIDLARRETQIRSERFAKTLIKELEKSTPVLRRPVRPANFKVLRAPDTPSVLVELGFMSNKDDLERLQSEEWRQETALSMMKAMDTWWENSPRGHFARR